MQTHSGVGQHLFMCVCVCTMLWGSCLWVSIIYPSYSTHQRNYHSNPRKFCLLVHLKLQFLNFLSTHCEMYGWNYVLYLPNCCMATLFWDSSYNQYTCCLIFFRNQLWEGNVKLAWHVPSIAYCELLKEIVLRPCMNVQNRLAWFVTCI